MTVNSYDASTLVARSLVQQSNGYTESAVLNSAVELGVFEHLASGPATEAEIRTGLGLHPRLTADFLDTLVGLGMLQREAGRYSNSAAVEDFLLPSAITYLGGVMARSARHHYQMWGRLSEALRDGQPKSEGLGGKNAFKNTYAAGPDITRQFLSHMDSYNGYAGPQLAKYLDWSRYKSFVDAGGARGNLAAQLVTAHPHLTGVVFDLPGLEPFFNEHMDHTGTAESVSFQGGDFFDEPLPQTDVLIFGHVLHDWPLETRQTLLQRAWPAVRPGGAVVIYDQMLDNERSDPHKLLASLNVRLVREGGSEYTVEECTAWAEKAGFRVTTVVELDTIGRDTMVVAEKVSDETAQA
ncbi:methyltransferase [Nocardia sp. NPDC046473]|uniref:methyltransferase n=1 Tax=Nocardia sp. NPDC046473 TaxID=3155733 RepID=UPI003410B7DE